MPPRSAPAAFPALKVSYYRRMKSNHVYPVTVAWGDRPKPVGSIKHVTVRLLGAGAQIVPSEQALDVTRPDLKATFFVTPLATGWLRAQRLEIVVSGRKMQEVPLASKVVCQRWAAFWFILAYVMAAILIWWQTTDPEWAKGLIHDHVPALPAIVVEKVPAVGNAWDKFWQWKGEAYASLCQFNKDRLVVFPVFIGLLLLALWSLLTHRDRRTSRWSQPVAIPTGAAEE